MHLDTGLAIFKEQIRQFLYVSACLFASAGMIACAYARVSLKPNDPPGEPVGLLIAMGCVGAV